jgi:RluA family pseudouridine synthase
MPRTDCIELSRDLRIPILYEDRSVLAIDKPPGWMLVPVSWQRTQRNLQTALFSSIGAGHFWARSRNIRYLRYIHRLDAETSGVLLLARSPGALRTLGELFETRRMEKIYLAVAVRKPERNTWTCRAALGPDPAEIGRMRADPRGKPAETAFRFLGEAGGQFLIEARPYTGRTHQIRIHLAESGCPLLGDALYGPGEARQGLGLRAVGLAYRDPFTRRPVRIVAPVEPFLSRFGFSSLPWQPRFESESDKPNRPAPGKRGRGSAPSPGKGSGRSGSQ